MTLTGAAIASIVIYTTWVCLIIRDRYHREKLLPKRPIHSFFVAEIVYNAVMTYFLIVKSPFFLYLTLATAFFHVCAGIYSEVFRPEARLDMTKFWSYVALDVSISLTCYLLSGV